MKRFKNSRSEFISSRRNSICSEIRIYRERKGYTQEYLAELMGISRATISKIENGKFALSIDYLAKFGWHLDFEIRIEMTE